MTHDSHLPSFIRSPAPASYGRGYSGFFQHQGGLAVGDAPVSWYPGTSAKHLILFVPGNPGILAFYDPFFESLYDELGKKVSILAHAHLGHTPKGPQSTTIGLLEQLDALLQVVDACSTHGYERVTLIGHSVGAWLAVQTMKQRLSNVDRVFTLFPTISQIASTPNGRRLSLFFRSPMPRTLATLSLLLRPFPRSFYSLLFPSWPENQLSVLQALLGDREVIHSALTMAHSEMELIREIDVAFLTQHTDRVWAYFAETDDWVGKERETVIRTLGESDRIEHCRLKMPHAFCLNHGEPMAARCALWYLGCEGDSVS
ncbi:hypothetical protein AURDEDRAFT_114075 [Auricularia subglabra TFB-10046 SS5]|nr:hypothetical protein AURDEDRAFT_114075 [Auricularia subglabra TFB-10046 SS5]